ncbi:PREDICTED: odorant receptor 4-like [Atta cephalotes]|uniref:Odorant receptor n=1 Tax=Atta cephalotes TaxID=12957 RepID=A0A158NZD5_ATTCE|nr:PREDICTED: odorant receptor 4-like [Atta cephalotes]
MVEYCCGLFAALRYNTKWYNMPVAARKLLIMIMMRSEKPSTLKLGKIIVLSYVTFNAIVNNMENVSGDINNYVYLNGLLLNVLFENWQGQKIIDSSEKVFKSAYNTKWYNMPVAARKLLIMIMMRSEKPSTLKLGKVIVLSYVTFNAVLALMTLHGDFDAIIECIPPLVVDFGCIIKLVNLRCNTKKIKILLIHIQRDWRSWTIKSEFEILHRFAESGRSITIAYAGGMYAFGSLFPFLAIIPKIIGKNVTSEYSTRPVGFPYHVEYYVDLEKYYYPILIHNYLATAIRLTILVATDTFVTILVQHCCVLFSVIRYRLEYIRKSIEQDKELALLEEDDKFYKNFTYCIQKHKDVLRFAKYLDAIYTKALFFEVGLIILAMSMSALQATSGTLNPPLAIRHASYITAQLLHLYIVCWLGQQIIDHSDHVYTSTYRGEWYESSPKSRKLLNMIMLRSISPCTLTVGKIMILSFPSFSAVKLDIIFFDYIHRRLKPLKGKRFVDVEEIKRNAMRELLAITKNDFQDCFQQVT